MTLIQHDPHLLTSYRPLPGSYDELLDSDGAIRKQWSHVGTALAGLGHDELLRRQFDVDRLLEALRWRPSDTLDDTLQPVRELGSG